MTWLAWRQLRFPVLSVYAVLAAAAVVLVATRPAGSGDFKTLHLGGLLALHALPAVLGAFWGVPMITRELEAGTHNLVWNQSVTRTRWLAVKIGVGAPAAVLAAGLLSLAVTWWASSADAAANDSSPGSEPRMEPFVFAARGVAPIGYAAFAFVLGIAIAILLRRTLTAVAVTLVVYAAVQAAFPLAVRPHVLPPVEETVAIAADDIVGIRAEEGSAGAVPESLTVAAPNGAWVLANETVDANGAEVFPLPGVVGDCLRQAPGGDVLRPDFTAMRTCFARLSDHGYRQHLAYHPASRFWPLQWLEVASYLALSALLTWFCFRRLRHLS